PDIYPLSLHDALPIWLVDAGAAHVGVDRRHLGGGGGRQREVEVAQRAHVTAEGAGREQRVDGEGGAEVADRQPRGEPRAGPQVEDRKSTRLNSSHVKI